MAMTVSNLKTSPWHLDIIALIVEHLRDRRDLYNCALVNRTFHCAVTPRLYRVLDVPLRVIRSTSGSSRIVHPACTLLRQPSYAHYVRRISETATAHDISPPFLPTSTAAFTLCTNLHSFTWTGGGFLSTSTSSLPSYLDIILVNSFPLRELVIRAASPGLSPDVWSRLKRIKGLKALGLWCLEIEHEALVEWLKRLGTTLVRLELVISPLSDRYMEYLSYLPHLRSLCLKAATRCSVPDILALLPTLTSLDVEYYGFSPISRRSPSSSSSSSSPSSSSPASPSPSSSPPPSPASPSYSPSPSPPPTRTPSPAPPIAALQALTITTSALSLTSPHTHAEMWTWIAQLVPHPQTLRSFTLRAFSPNPNGSENVEMPGEFVEFLGRVHGERLEVLEVEGVVVPLCGGGPGVKGGKGRKGRVRFPMLERLACALPRESNITNIETFLTDEAPNLLELKLTPRSITLKLEDARRWMTRELSQLRTVEVGETIFTGKWMLEEKTGEKCFEVMCDGNRSYITWI